LSARSEKQCSRKLVCEAKLAGPVGPLVCTPRYTPGQGVVLAAVAPRAVTTMRERSRACLLICTCRGWNFPPTHFSAPPTNCLRICAVKQPNEGCELRDLCFGQCVTQCKILMFGFARTQSALQLFFLMCGVFQILEPRDVQKYFK
jgi:hypothetical protein